VLMNRVKQAVLMLAAALAVHVAAQAQTQSAPDIVGTWHGTAKSPAGEITLVLHVERGADAMLSAKIENATQSPGNLAPLSEIKVTSGHLTFRNVRGNVSYEGDWDSATQVWKGTLTTGPGTPGAINFTKGAPPPWQLPPDSEIARLIAERNAPRAGQGIVVGVLGPDGRRIVAGGTGAGAKFDGGTLFEVGSISKVFTAMILADMVNKGEVSLDDDLVGKHRRVRTAPMPNWVKVATDAWTSAAAITDGQVFRPVNRADRVSGDVLSEKVVWQLIKPYAEVAGVPGIAPHDLRRTCAKLCRAGGGELEQIQLLLGHASVQTTARYLGTRQDLVHAPNDAIKLRVAV